MVHENVCPMCGKSELFVYQEKGMQKIPYIKGTVIDEIHSSFCEECEVKIEYYDIQQKDRN